MLIYKYILTSLIAKSVIRHSETKENAKRIRKAINSNLDFYPKKKKNSNFDATWRD